MSRKQKLPASPGGVAASTRPAGAGSIAGWPRGDWLWAATLVAAIFLSYLPVAHAGFIWDDDAHLTANPCIVGPLGLKEIWTTPAANYFPLVLTSLWVQHALWGLTPLPYHVVNVLLHAGSAVLLWRVLRRLKVRGAWLGAALWALHPVQVESVAWISEMKNTQSGFLYLAAIWFFLRWVEQSEAVDRLRPSRNYTLALSLGALAILSKPSTVMLPVALGLAWWWLTKRWRWRQLLWLAPFGFLSAAAAGWTIWEQKFHSGAIGATWNQTFPERFAIAGRVIWFYLGKLLWPDRLIFVYPRWSIDPANVTAFVPAIGALVGLAVLAWFARGASRPLWFAFGYFVALLVPVLGFFSIYFFRYSFVGDHFQYLASIGPLALTAAAIATATDFLRQRHALVSCALGAVPLVTLGALTWRHTGTFRDLETLWRTTFDRNPTCWLAAYNLGTAIAPTGKLDEADGLFRKALALKPDYTEAHINLGNVLLQEGRGDEAKACYETALKLNPNEPEAHYDMGLVFLREGKPDAAILHLQASLAVHPEDADAHYNLGRALDLEDRTGEAIAHYQRARLLKPDDSRIANDLAVDLFEAGRPGDAVALWEKVLTEDPSNLDVRYRLAWVLATSPDPAVRDGARAVALAEETVRITRGENPLFLCALAAGYAETGRFADAVETAQRALRLAPSAGDRELAQSLQGQIILYERHSPVRDPGSSRAAKSKGHP